MKVGNLKLYTAVFFFLFFYTPSLYAEKKINLNILQPTFEEEAQTDETSTEETSSIN